MSHTQLAPARHSTRSTDRRPHWGPALVLATAPALAVLAFGGCRGDFNSNDEGQDVDVDADMDVDADVDADLDVDADTDVGPECEDEDGTLSESCPNSAPFCLDQECAPCSALPLNSCGAADPNKPVCDGDSGACVQCTEVDATQCGGDTPVCGSTNQCVPCTSNSQCPTGACLPDGHCLLEEVVLTGVVYRYGSIDEVDPRSDAQITIKNIAGLANPPPTDADGVYELQGIPPFSLVQLGINAPHDDIGFFIPPSLRTVVATTVQNESPVQYDLPVVSYGWMAQVAFECGEYPTLEEAQGGGVVNTYFTQRSTVFGRLVDSRGDSIQGISRQGVQISLNGTNNVHDGTEGDATETTLCFLEKGPDGILHGTTSNFSGTSGHFVMFRMQNAQGTGAGTAIVNAPGFDPVTIKLSSTGEIGIVTLTRNDEDIPRDYETEVYPIFTSHGCIGCHVPGGVAYETAPIRAGYHADWSGTPDEVYEHLTGPGTDCVDPENPNDPGRVCVNDPMISLLLTRPLADEIGVDDPHPVDIFPSLDDPAATIILEWIEQGAERGTPQAPVDFESQIYPIFTAYGCAGCHNPGSQVFGQIPVREGFVADWSAAPMDVYENLTGPGKVCAGEIGRVCTDEPLESLLVTRPLTNQPGEEDPHPVDIFPSIEDPSLKLIIRWIEEGAHFTPQG